MASSLSISSLSLLAKSTHPLKPTSFTPRTPSHSASIKSSVDRDSTSKTKLTNNGRTGSWVSPDWLTSVARSLNSGRDDSGIPIASAKLEDVSDLLGGALFLPLFKWMREYGPIYRLAAGPRNFVVVSDPAIAKHVLRNYGKYAKGLVSEVSEFLFGSGFAIAEGPLWTVRRRAVVPSLHKKYLSLIVDRVFCKCAQRLVEKLIPDALNGTAVNMEEKFSQLTLDVIGLSVFNYNFDSLTADSPVIDAVYTALKEAEARSTDLLPYWKVKALCKIIPRQVKAEKAVSVIRRTVEELISKCKEIVECEGERIDEEEYINDTDPSILRFLLASREKVSSVQLRDDLLSMLVAGHETTGSVLTWTLYLLSKVWERAEEFVPERFELEGPVPNETNTDFRFIPFSGGPRKCVGDQFALLEAIAALAIFLQHLDFELVPDQSISMTTGATIHTTNGLYMKLAQRNTNSAAFSLPL
ncbi:carotene epsilon-monooxygenase, chloroplastic isoform X4 [Malania oleifera]|uniref:carotene epsilon-monooxygenase, chloroplastic isoform X4 n=1 Tax=Malania oleifera TaxID=397392 RepID=UPI0025AE1987|nr:carotene epsilon-monooxygenase, chloroplastic isoform X4 [Malania oleifera]